MPKKVLIAEDQPDSRRLLEDILTAFQPYGVITLIARDGNEAYDIAVREKPELILLDVMMPGISGIDVCKKVKSHPDLMNTYVIMVSARIQQEDRTEAAMAGADEYMTKPYEVSMMMERIQMVLGVNLLQG